MSTDRVFVFGNPDIEIDAVAVRLLPALRAAFPEISFEVLDPNEEWDVPAHMLIIDTVVNIDEITVFHDLKRFLAAPRLTCHDFDAYANLMLMLKLKKITAVTIIGLPPGGGLAVLTPQVTALLRELLARDEHTETARALPRA
jgi:hypothetical protein